MTVSTLAPRALRQMQAPPPPDNVTQYALDVVAGRIVAGILVRKACERHLRDLSDGHTRGLRFDAEEAGRAIAFFGLLRHYKGEWGPGPGKPLGDRIVLGAWEKFIVGSAFGWKRANGTRRFRSVYLEVAKKNGKALSLDTPIPTPTGWTTMGEIAKGDQVIDERGQPTTVTFATAVMVNHPCFRVAFSDGTAVIADADHQWQTERLDHHGYVLGVRTTEEIAATLARSDGARRHRIAIAGPLQLPEADLLIDPYVLGVWLGDGDTTTAMLTCADDEILEAVASAGVSVGPPRVSGERTPRYLLGGNGRSQAGRNASLQADLRRLGVLGNKHVPAAYLRGSADQRLALLQGLMDTDGHVTPRGQCEFTTTRPQLRDGFLELARSLGYKPVSREGVATIGGRPIGPKWRITFHGQRDRAPFRLARKLLRVAAVPERVRRSSHRHIVAVEPVESVPVRCIQVDSPSHLFLAGPAMVPTHNTLLAAVIGILLAFFDGEPGAEVYSVATKRDQAKLSWNDAVQMVKRNPELAARLETLALSLTDLSTASFFRPLGRDSDSDQGINPHGAIVDELHVLESSDSIDNIETATSARRQPMVWKITTAGVKRESVWAQERADALSVVEGRATDDSMLVLIFTLDEGDDPFDEAVWPKANPNLGVSVKLDTLREQAEVAKRSPGKLAAYLRFRMNVPTAVATKAIDIDEWDKCADEPIIPAGAYVYGGLDLASVRDLTALILIHRDAEGFYNIECWFWCPEEGIEQRSRVDGVPYADWVRDDFLIATPGNVTDYSFVEAKAKERAEALTLAEIGYDRWNATQLVTNLTSDGATMVPISQTHAGLAAGWREFEKAILEHKIRHGGNPVLRWMAGNVEVETDAAGNQKPSKAHSSERIDGIIGATMGVGRWIAVGEPAIWTAA